MGWLKAVAGLTRRHAIPVFTWLDACGATRREGDVRVAGSRARQYAEEADERAP
ncbi:MAG: SelB C-terminal domain-containing protein [Myxococcales bacterium]|nr:SelB C-terminal domain-containing protein [Myxococcales bacterium]